MFPSQKKSARLIHRAFIQSVAYDSQCGSHPRLAAA